VSIKSSVGDHNNAPSGTAIFAIGFTLYVFYVSL
jgi:hypothetical protein